MYDTARALTDWRRWIRPTRRDPREAEVMHWNAVERHAAANRERMFWLQQPRIAWHYERKSLVEGKLWQYWVPDYFGGPAENALELGCGNGEALASLLRAPTAKHLSGVDLDESRFAGAAARSPNVRFAAADINQIELEESSYDLIYSIQAFHHFENLEHIFEQITRALRPGGLCVLDEFVGPARFQWTDTQLLYATDLLSLIPRPLRMCTNGVEKREEKRSSVEDVIRVCPSEAIRSNEIVPLFEKTFDVLYQNQLGGTIQHLVYSGIVHNLPDNQPETDRMIDAIDRFEGALIEANKLGSDFVLLVGRKKG